MRFRRCALNSFIHTRKHKSPLCLREHSGGSHLTLPELGACQELIPASLRQQTITSSDQSGEATWHLNSSSCSVYIMYIPRQWGRDRVTEGKERNGGWWVKSKQWKAHWWEETYIVSDVAGVSVLWLTALVRLNVPQRSARNYLEHNFIVVQNLLPIPTKGYKKVEQNLCAPSGLSPRSQTAWVSNIREWKQDEERSVVSWWVLWNPYATFSC